MHEVSGCQNKYVMCRRDELFCQINCLNHVSLYVRVSLS